MLTPSSTTHTAFFSSTGRTGTDFFTKLFNEDVANAWSVHEPKPAMRRRASRLMVRPPNRLEVLRFRYTRLRQIKRRPEQWYVETNYHLFAAGPLIKRAFPQALHFHIVRDGRAVVTSWLNRYRYITNSHITPQAVGDHEAARWWPDWNPLQKLSWYWTTVNRHVRLQAPQRIYRFEDIFTDPVQSQVFDILAWFPGTDFDGEQIGQRLQQKVNRNPQAFFPPYAQWPDYWQTQFWEIAGREMECYGYC
jgi:hypothetical protein